MKVGSDPNYVIRVMKKSGDVDPELAPLYEGMYTFSVNHAFSISFVPRVTAAGPPWSLDGVPDDMSEFTTAEHARLLEVLSKAYSVTPDDELAGTGEQLPWLFEWPDPYDALASSDQPTPTPTVFFVSTEEFDRLAADLSALTEIAGSLHSMVRHAKVAEHEAVRFIDQRILPSPLLRPFDAVSAGQAR